MRGARYGERYGTNVCGERDEEFARGSVDDPGRKSLSSLDTDLPSPHQLVHGRLVPPMAEKRTFVCGFVRQKRGPLLPKAPQLRTNGLYQ